MSSSYSSSSTFPFLLTFIILTAASTTAQPDFLYHFCNNNNGNHTSKPGPVLKSLLSSLPARTPTSGFYTFSSGPSHYKLNAAALCRGDIKSEECRVCVEEASRKLTEVCPVQKEAVGWYDNCMVKYSNNSLTETTWPKFYMWNVNNVTTRLEIFNRNLGKMMKKLKNRAMGGGNLRKFSTGIVENGEFQKLYGLAQCTPDISKEKCGECLDDAIGSIPDCCDGNIGGRVVGPSCNIRFEVYKFFES